MRANHTRRAMALSIVAAALAGCTATAGGGGRDAVYDAAIRTEVEQQLAQSSARVANAHETLAMVQRARTPVRAEAVDETGLPDELRRRTTVEWSGPAVNLVRELASNIGYSFTEQGNAPANPALAQVDIRDASVVQALADLQLQVQASATIAIDPNIRRITYIHSPGAASPSASVPVQPRASSRRQASQPPRPSARPASAPSLRSGS